MKMMSYTDELIVRGATLRLEELNKEREHLIKLIEKRNGKTPLVVQKKEEWEEQQKKRAKHWTQTPAGRLKMSRAQKKVWRERRRND